MATNITTLINKRKDLSAFGPLKRKDVRRKEKHDEHLHRFLNHGI